MILKSALRALGLSLALAAAPVSAQDTFPPMPPVGEPKPFTAPSGERFTLGEGVEVTLVPYGLAPLVTVNVRVQAGTLNEGEEEGVSDLVAAMLKEGAGGRSAAEIATAAAAMGGDLSASATAHETALGMTVLSEHAGEAVELLGAVLRQPDFPPAALERIKQDQLRALAVAKSQPQPVAEWAMARLRYGADHPYGRVFASEEKLAAYTIEDLRRFYDANFGAQRTRVYVAGRFDAAEVRSALEAAFADWSAGPAPLALPPKPNAGPQVALIDRPGAPQTTLLLAYPAPGYAAAGDVEMRVMDALLAGAFTSRITKNIREDKGYTYSPFSDLAYNLGDAAWVWQADVTTDVTGASLKEVFKEIRTLQTTPPSAEEGKGIRTWLSGLFVLQNASPGGLIGSLAARDLHGAPADYLDTYVPSVLAVTDTQIQETAKSRLPLDKLTLVVVGDLKAVKPQLKALPELKGVSMQTFEAP